MMEIRDLEHLSYGYGFKKRPDTFSVIGKSSQLDFLLVK
jgi:hypothetical protein